MMRALSIPDVVSRRCVVAEFTVEFRAVPRLAGKPVGGELPCGLCRLASGSDVRVAGGYAMVRNEYPFAHKQRLVLNVDHQATLDPLVWRALPSILAREQAASASYQERGSGATVPEHGHVSIFDENLPLLEAVSFPKAGLAIAQEYPGWALAVSWAILQRTTLLGTLLAEFGRRSVPVNVEVWFGHGALIIPRTRPRASVDAHGKVASRRMGNLEMGGIFLSNCEGCADADLTAREQWMVREIYQLHPSEVVPMLAEVTYPSGYRGFDALLGFEV